MNQIKEQSDRERCYRKINRFTTANGPLPIIRREEKGKAINRLSSNTFVKLVAIVELTKLNGWNFGIFGDMVLTYLPNGQCF